MKKVVDLLGQLFVKLVCGWVVFALCLMTYGIYLHFTNEKREQELVNEFDWKFDGTFKDQPGNIWYEEPKIKIKIENKGNKSI